MAGLIAWGGASTAVAEVPKTLEGTYATATVGDLPGMIDRVAELANKVNPGITGDAIKAQLGMFLGDAGLKSIPAGSGIMMAVPVKGRPYVLLETAAGKADTIAEGIKRRSGYATNTSGGNLIVVAKTKEDLDAIADGQTSAAAEMLKGIDDKFVQAVVDADKLAADKGGEWSQDVDKMAAKAGKKNDKNSSSTASSVKIVGDMILGVARRTDVATLKIDISADGVTFDRAMYVKGGIHLDQPEGPTAEELRKGLVAPKNALVSFDYHLDSQSSMKALAPLLQESISGAGLAPADKAEMEQLYREGIDAYGDAFTGWINPTADGTHGSYVVSVQSAEAGLKLVEDKIASLSSGTLARMYEGCGIVTSGDLKRNAETIEGQQVSTFNVNVDAKADKKSSKDMAKFGDVKNGRIAFEGNKMVITLGNTSIAEAIKAVTENAGGAEALVSRKTLPAGGFMYADLRPSSLAESGLIRHDDAKKALSTLGDSTITNAGYVDTESIRAITVIPADMIQKAAKSMSNKSDKKSDDEKSDDDN